MPGEVAEVDVQRPGEEQEPEHPVQQHLVEVELAQDRPGLLRDRRDERPSANRHKEKASDSAISPIVVGSLSRRKLR